MAVLGWLEMPKDDERPPEEIWKDSEQIAAWFQDVKDRRDREFGEDKADSAPPLEQNEATRGLRERLSGK